MTVQQPTRSLHAAYTTRRDSSFLPARASFKFSQFAQAVLDIFAVIYGLFYLAVWITVILGLIPFALFCLFLIQF